jgi:hypothetical protein
MDTFFMDTVLDPMLAMLAICFPLVMTYVIVSLQTCKLTSSCRKSSAISRNDFLQHRRELSHAEEKYGTRMLPTAESDSIRRLFTHTRCYLSTGEIHETIFDAVNDSLDQRQPVRRDG